MGGFFSALCGRRPVVWDLVGARYRHTDERPSSQFTVFVSFAGHLISVEVTHDTTVQSAVYLAFSKVKHKIPEFRAIYQGPYEDRVLCLEKTLVDEAVDRYSTIMTCIEPHSGGGKSYFRLDFMSFLDRMNELPSKNEWLEIKGSTCVLSKLGRQMFKKLFEMVSLYHARNKCFGGTYRHQDIIYVPSADSYMIIRHSHLENEDCVHVVDFTPDGYKKDIEALGRVLDTVCMMKLECLQGGNIAYVAHLLKIMRVMPQGAESSDTFKAFLRNHPCMMSATSRQGLIMEVHRHIKFQQHPSMENVLQSPYNWCWVAESDVDFSPVYFYRWWLWPLRGTAYYDNEWSWLTFCRNFLSHPNRNMTIQDADIAIWWYFSDHLADFLCRLSCTHGFTVNIFDKDWFSTHPAAWERYQTCTIHYEHVPQLEHSEEEPDHSEVEPGQSEEEPEHSGEEPEHSQEELDQSEEEPEQSEEESEYSEEDTEHTEEESECSE